MHVGLVLSDANFNLTALDCCNITILALHRKGIKINVAVVFLAASGDDFKVTLLI